MAKYEINGKQVTEEEFNRQVFNGVEGTIKFNEPFFLDEVVEIPYWFKSSAKKLEEKQELEKLRSNILNFKSHNSIEDITKIMLAEDEKELLEHLKNTSHTGGTVFEKVQDSTIPNKNIEPFYVVDIKNIKSVDLNDQDPLDAYNAITGHSIRHHKFPEKSLEEKVKKSKETYGTKIDLPEFPNDYLTYLVNMYNGDFNSPEKFTVEDLPKFGKKESKTVEKAPIFTYCKQMKNAIEALSLRSLAGHKKYEKGDDWENFSRVENGDFEYSNAEFRHALGIGEDSDEDHLVAAAWNAVSRLEIHLRNKK